MSVLYNIKEIKLNGKSIKNVHVAPVTDWSAEDNRKDWASNDIVSMNVLKKLVVPISTKTKEEQLLETMLQKNAYLFKDANIAAPENLPVPVYRESLYQMPIEFNLHNDLDFQILNVGVTDITTDNSERTKEFVVPESAKQILIADKFVSCPKGDPVEGKLRPITDQFFEDEYDLVEGAATADMVARRTPYMTYYTMTVSTSVSEIWVADKFNEDKTTLGTRPTDATHASFVVVSGDTINTEATSAYREMRIDILATAATTEASVALLADIPAYTYITMSLANYQSLAAGVEHAVIDENTPVYFKTNHSDVAFTEKGVLDDFLGDDAYFSNVSVIKYAVTGSDPHAIVSQSTVKGVAVVGNNENAEGNLAVVECGTWTTTLENLSPITACHENFGTLAEGTAGYLLNVRRIYEGDRVLHEGRGILAVIVTGTGSDEDPYKTKLVYSPESFTDSA